MKSCAAGWSIYQGYVEYSDIYEMAIATKSPDYYLEDNTMTQYGEYMGGYM